MTRFFKTRKTKAKTLQTAIDKAQQAYFSVNPQDPAMTEKIIVEQIKRGDYV